MLKRLATRPMRWALNLAGRVYVPGPRLEDALGVAARLAPEGMASTLGYFHSPADSPRAVAQTSLSIVDAVAQLEPKAYVSIKAPACRYDPKLIASIALRARDKNILAHFDSHEHHTSDATLECVRQAVALGARVGVTLPGRWRRSVADAEQACRLGIRTRVVKGEWADPGDPQKDRRHGFLEVVECLAGRVPEVAIATHDPWLARESLSRLQAAGTPCELELLNGLPKRALLPIAREFSVPVRIYIPFGIAWRPYALSKLGDNPRMLWWLIQDGAQGLYAALKR
jgi:proline dehydrogenase